jgi:hypothetical protein
VADDILLVVMGSAVLLTALIGAPLLGSALQARASPSQQMLRALALPIGAGVAFAAAWLLLAQPEWQLVVGGWSPVSLTGLPLAIASFQPAHGLLVAWVAVYSAHLLMDGPANSRPADYALLTLALLMAAFADNFITLLVGLGLVDLSTLYHRLRRGRSEDMRTAWLGLALNSVGVLSLAMLGAVHAAGGGSLHLSLMQLSPSASPILALAAAPRLGFVPFRLPDKVESGLFAQAGMLSAFFLLMRLPQLTLPAWFYGLGIVSALLCLLLRDPRAPHPAIAAAGAHLAALSAALATPGAIAAAASAWLLSVALLNLASPRAAAPRRDDLILRLLGAACLVGFPFTVGFAGQAGLFSLWAAQEATHWLLTFGWVVAMASLADALFALFAAPPPSPATCAPCQWWMSRLSLLIPVAVFSAFPTLLGAGGWDALLNRSGLPVDVLLRLTALSFGALLWQLRRRWPARWSAWYERVAPVLNLAWLHELLAGVMRRLHRPCQSVFAILESDSILAWAVLIALVLILLARAGGP